MKITTLALAVVFACGPAWAADSKKKPGPTLPQQLDQAGQRLQELAKDAPKEIDKQAKSLDKQTKGVGDRLGELFQSGMKQCSQAWKSFTRWLFGEPKKQ